MCMSDEREVLLPWTRRKITGLLKHSIQLQYITRYMIHMSKVYKKRVKNIYPKTSHFDMLSILLEKKIRLENKD